MLHPTLVSESNSRLVAIVAYLAGDLAGVQSAFAPETSLLSDVLSSVPAPSSACSPIEVDDTIVAPVTMRCAA